MTVGKPLVYNESSVALLPTRPPPPHPHTTTTTPAHHHHHTRTPPPAHHHHHHTRTPPPSKPAPAHHHPPSRYVFCRQRQDEQLRRGAEQKSVVILSEHPGLSSVLSPLSQHLGPLFFNDGVGALQALYDEVCQWDPPSFGVRGVVAAGTLSLPVSLPPPATLPPPCPFDVLGDDGRVPGLRHVPGQTMLGPFHEVRVLLETLRAKNEWGGYPPGMLCTGSVVDSACFDNVPRRQVYHGYRALSRVPCVVLRRLTSSRRCGGW